MVSLMLLKEEDDTVLLKGKDRQTVSTAYLDDKISTDFILLNSVARGNLNAELGQMITVSLCSDIKYGRKIICKTIGSKFTPNKKFLIEAYLKPHFLKAFRPVHEGDFFTLQGVQFRGKLKESFVMVM